MHRPLARALIITTVVSFAVFALLLLAFLLFGGNNILSFIIPILRGKDWGIFHHEIENILGLIVLSIPIGSFAALIDRLAKIR